MLKNFIYIFVWRYFSELYGLLFLLFICIWYVKDNLIKLGVFNLANNGEHASLEEWKYYLVKIKLNIECKKQYFS